MTLNDPPSSSAYESYLSSLESLIFNSPELVTQSEKEINEELALWSNTQFTYDFKPTEKEEKRTPEVVAAEQFEKVTGLDPITYESLANYLDCELPRQQGVRLTSAANGGSNDNSNNSSGDIAKNDSPASSGTVISSTAARRILPRPLAPAPPQASPVSTAYCMPAIAPAAPIAKRPILLPKTSEPTKAAAHTATTTTTTTTTTTLPLSSPKTPIELAPAQKRSRPLDETEEHDHRAPLTAVPDDDKRRRNTAASARFREKKKLREQAMEQSVREMTIKSDKLQERVNQLEQEIKLLRDLLLDKVMAVNKQ